MDLRILTFGYMRKNAQKPLSHASFADQDALISDEVIWTLELVKRLRNRTRDLLQWFIKSVQTLPRQASKSLSNEG